VKRVYKLAGIVAAFAVLAGLSACDKDKDIEPPAKLVAFKATLAIKNAWSLHVGGKDAHLRLGLTPLIVDGVVYAAAADGQVVAVQLASGKVVWKTQTKLPLAGGPGVGAGLVVVGASDGRLWALDAKSGAPRWKVMLNGEILTTPLVTEQRVVVRTTDSRIHGLETKTGAANWSNEESMPRLSLRGLSKPVLANDAVLVGFDSGKVAAYALLSGDLLWSTTVSPSKGKTELDRLVDFDGDMAVAGRELYVAGYQGRAAMLALDSGQLWWSHDASSVTGVGLVNSDVLVMSSDDGDVVGLKPKDGTSLWKQSALRRRNLTAPVAFGNAVVVADFEGYVHWLDATDGHLLARMSTAKKKPIRVTPAVSDEWVVVQNEAGSLYAFKTQAVK
jgi:outer membrane protein assembly factor BamB